MADAFTQALLNSPVWVQLIWIQIMLAFIVWMATPLLWTWMFFRFFRDVHSMQRAMWAHYDLARGTVEPSPLSRSHEPAPAGKISMSAFGR